MKLIENELDGKKVVYHEKTMFYIQVGRFKNSYKVKMSFQGSLSKAVMYYNCINIGRGYKKRLVMEDKVLARYIS